MEIIVKGTKAECSKVKQSFAELAQIEALLAPMCSQMLGMPLSCNINDLLTNIRYEFEDGEA